MADQDRGQRARSSEEFPTTQWSLVALASDTQGEAARERLCRQYWFPLYAFARRSGQTVGDAEDSTQGFFQRMLEKNWLAGAEREKGRLRTFLLTAFQRYMANERRRDHAVKRGRGWSQVTWDQAEGESRYLNTSADARPEDLFDRQWALTLLERTLASLEEELTNEHQARHFEQLKQVLMLERGAINYAELAKSMGIKQGAARVAVHRLRKQFRLRFREAVAQTLENEEDLDEELRYVAQVLAS